MSLLFSLGFFLIVGLHCKQATIDHETLKARLGSETAQVIPRKPDGGITLNFPSGPTYLNFLTGIFLRKLLRLSAILTVLKL